MTCCCDDLAVSVHLVCRNEVCREVDDVIVPLDCLKLCDLVVADLEAADMAYQ